MRRLIIGTVGGGVLLLVGGIAVVPAHTGDPPIAQLGPGVAQWVCAHTAYCNSTP